MNRFLFLILAALVLSGSVLAQPTTQKIYMDSLVYAATPSEASNAAWLVLGYGKSINLRSDVGKYKDKMLCVKFAKKTDSIAIYGGRVNFGIDTTWEQLAVPVPTLKRLTGINTGAGADMVRDTCVKWLSPVTTNLHDFTVDMSGFFYPAYKIRFGVFDSGKVYIQDIRRGGY